MLHLTAPVQYSSTKCGSYISKVQPDVEVLAIALDDIPQTAAEFDAKRGSRDFIIVKFLVVDVGPPGFGKVPYKHKNKAKKPSSEDEQGKCLYETAESGLVKFYAYEKGDTNKDKGVRCDDCFGALCPGLSLTFFLREEMFQPTKILSETAIPKLNFVCLQIASSNVSGASAGYLLKLKKIKSIPAPADLMHSMAKIPRTEAAYDVLMGEYRSTYPSMTGSISDRLEVKYCAVSSMGSDVFADYDGADGFVICNAAIDNKEGFTDEIVVHESLVFSCFDTKCVQTALRIFNVALSLDAVSLILQTAPETTIALNEDRPTAPNTALHLLCDYNKLFMFDAFKNATTLAWLQDRLRVFAQGAQEDMKAEVVVGNMQFELAKEAGSKFSTLMYTNTDVVYRDHANIEHQIHICIHEEVQTAPEVAGTSAPKFISHDKCGPYNRVDIRLQPHNCKSPPATIASLQMRRGNMSSVGSKRKRPNLFEEA